ncbi:hypothetical protein R3W88_005036 [Solanum pinnatisectum]|uniref:Uncharacterized protein n=1 Tax=Solanum pinnatisectum TaxID=50273 RepID=A0AAV9KBG9_9SOLN|nr:hypothetical protein R3W88_005036 [Solanum pinnatisectum]
MVDEIDEQLKKAIHANVEKGISAKSELGSSSSDQKMMKKCGYKFQVIKKLDFRRNWAFLLLTITVFCYVNLANWMILVFLFKITIVP